MQCRDVDAEPIRLESKLEHVRLISLSSVTCAMPNVFRVEQNSFRKWNCLLLGTTHGVLPTNYNESFQSSPSVLEVYGVAHLR
jgi:hypothetical protein